MAIKQSSSESEGRSTRKNDILRIVALVLGDAIVFLIFAMIGRSSHNETSGLAAIGQVVQTSVPFVLGWFIVAPFVGAFKRSVLGDPVKMAKRTLLAWACSWPVAMGLRGLLVDHKVPPLSFWIVVLISNTIFLSIWRNLFAFVCKKIDQRSAVTSARQRNGELVPELSSE